MKAMEKAKMVKFKEGLKAKASKPSAMITAKQDPMAVGLTAEQPPMGGVTAKQPPMGGVTAKQPPMGGIVATTPAELIAQERKSKLEGMVELGPTETEYSPVKKYLMKRGSK